MLIQIRMQLKIVLQKRKVPQTSGATAVRSTQRSKRHVPDGAKLLGQSSLGRCPTIVERSSGLAGVLWFYQLMTCVV